MAIEQRPPEIPRVEVSPITERDLEGAAAGKLLHKRVTELETENMGLKAEATLERTRREEILAQLLEVQARAHALEGVMSSLGHRESVTRLLWIVLTFLLVLAVDAVRKYNWANCLLFAALTGILVIAIYLVNRVPRGTKVPSR